MRLVIAAAIAGGVIHSLIHSPVHAQTRYTSDDTRAAIHQASNTWGVSEGFLDCIIRRESTYDPYAVGAQGERGAAQLHPLGKLAEFYRRGYFSEWSPYQALDFLASQILEGEGYHWAGWHACIAR